MVTQTDSILDSIKSMLGDGEGNESFDSELILHINGYLMIMTQLGVGPPYGFLISSNIETWDQFLLGRKDLALVYNAVYLRVKLIFDPPPNSFLVTAIERQIKECDWRISEWHNNPQPPPEV